MEPLARALDILQSDIGMYMGYVLPVLSILQQKLENLNKSNFIDCHSLVKAIQQGLNKSLFIKLYIDLLYLLDLDL